MKAEFPVTPGTPAELRAQLEAHQKEKDPINIRGWLMRRTNGLRTAFFQRVKDSVRKAAGANTIYQTPSGPPGLPAHRRAFLPQLRHARCEGECC